MIEEPIITVVRITQASKPTYWYANKINKCYQVVPSKKYDMATHSLQNDWIIWNSPMYHIDKDDCIIITKNPKL